MVEANTAFLRRSSSSSKHWIPYIVVVIAYAIVSLVGITWGLPNKARSSMYEASLDDVVGSGESRLFVTGPLQSYHVDECSALMPLARMRPKELKLNPQWFHWGTFHLYGIGVALVAAESAGIVRLTTDRAFYLTNPHEMGKVYLVSRILSFLAGLGVVILFISILRKFIRSSSIVFAVGGLLVLSPMFVLYSHFATPDVSLMFWVLLAAFLASDRDGASPGWKALFASFIAAGFAGSVKFYGGLAVLFPLAQVVAHRNLRNAFVGMAVSVVAFLVGTPYALLDWSRFLADLKWQWAHVQHGHGDAFLGTPHSLVYHWAESLPAGVSPLTTVLMAIALGWFAFKGRKRLFYWAPTVFLILFWIQVARSPLKFSRYLLPALPFHFLLLAGFLDDLWAERSKRAVALLLCLGMVLSEGVLTAGHLKVLTGIDVRDQAGAWLEKHGDHGDTVFFPGRPYFASPPVSRKKFNIEVGSLSRESLLSRKPRWVILTDYDTEPLGRAPAERPVAVQALDLLSSTEGGTYGYKCFTFHTAPRPPLFVTWGKRILPHDLRYHCPEIRIYERVALRGSS